MASKIRKPVEFDAIQSTQRARREAHFAAGGTLAMWRGAASKFADRRFEANKNACRRYRGEE